MRVASVRENEMNFRMACAVAGASLALLVSPVAQAATVVWTQWNSNAAGTMGAVNVTYSGEMSGLLNPGGGSFQGYIPNSSFLGGPVGNVPTNANGALKLIGGGGEDAVTNTITFSEALFNPVFLIWSLGQGGIPTRFDFLDNPSITIVAGGPTTQYGGGGLTLSGTNAVGVEGNGVLQFNGAVTSISWKNPVAENYYAFTVGNVVPEPGTWALMICGFGLAGAALRHRRTAVAA
jgi:hypothetical protein